MKTEKFEFHYVGLSRDQRTNKWTVRCLKCGTTHEPDTTMMAWQKIECKKKNCDQSEVVNYNDIMDKL